MKREREAVATPVGGIARGTMSRSWLAAAFAAALGVTLYFALRREIGFADAALYGAVQIGSAIAGVWLAHAMFAAPIL